MMNYYEPKFDPAIPAKANAEQEIFSKTKKQSRKSISSEKIFQKYGNDFILPCKRHKHLLPQAESIDWDQALKDAENNADRQKEIFDGVYWKFWRLENAIDIGDLFAEPAHNESIVRTMDAGDEVTEVNRRNESGIETSVYEPKNLSNNCYIDETDHARPNSEIWRRQHRNDISNQWISKGWHSTRNNRKSKISFLQNGLDSITSMSRNHSISDHDSISSSSSMAEYLPSRAIVENKSKVQSKTLDNLTDDINQRKLLNNDDKSEDSMSDELLEYESSSSTDIITEKQRSIRQSRCRVLTLQHSSSEVIKDFKQKERNRQSNLKTHPRFSFVRDPIRSSFECMPLLSNIRKKQTTLDEAFTPTESL